MVTVATNTEGTPTVWCDPEIEDLVTALQPIGTIASCSGHGHRPGSIILKDGRYLMVFESMEQAQPAENAFPVDINGETS